MNLLKKSYSFFSALTTRGAGDLFIGSNVHLRTAIQNQQLIGVKVAVLHNSNQALLVSKILQDHGAKVSHYAVKGDTIPSLSNVRELDLHCEQGKSYFTNVLRKSDVFLDGHGDSHLNCYKIKKSEIVKKNGQLIIATVDGDDPFSAIYAMKNIAIGLYLREKNTAGEIIENLDSQAYLEELREFAGQASKR